ncbi:MAG: hypothetical protein B6D44_13240 [Ignavibacteriales bacterium UTCHB2]|jgi:glycosyltransferase involved in cell wall biosynthesis|nr:MAG: hypothetical protein B6D44_13240 [Ignavibacteriales bacterium UTCHB2]
MITNPQFELTVCLLIYNHEHLIEKVITSILEQSYPDFQFLISDDFSIDNSYEIAKKYENVDPRVNVFQTPKNLGMAGNTNFCLSKVKTTFIALLHHDDILEKTLLERWLSLAHKSINISFVFNDYLVNNIAGHKFEKRNFFEIMNGKKFLNNYLLRTWGCPVRGTALIRKKYFDEIGGMDERFGMLADIDLWMRLAAKYDVGYVDKPLMEVIQDRPDNYPKDYTEFSWIRFFILFDIHSNNINRNNFPNYFHYLVKRFVFRNKVSFEIIKWFLYGLIRKKHLIIKDYEFKFNKYEYFYSRLIRFLICKIVNK